MGKKCYISKREQILRADYMQTVLLNNPPALGTPWLEPLSSDTHLPSCIPLERFPFTIGRKETVDLQIDSSRVSREHAQIIKENGAFRIVDLKSTNGTFVNGAKIRNSPLCDGDMFAIANEEFTFFSGDASPSARMETQVIENETTTEAIGGDLPRQVIRAIRQLQEMLLQGGLKISWEMIFRLSDGQPYGFEARSWDESETEVFSDAERMVLAIDCRLTARIRNLSRTLAVEEAADLPGAGPVFIRFDTKDLGGEGMSESIFHLRSKLPHERRLILTLPYTAACNMTFPQELHRRLRAKEIGLAYYDFAELHEKSLQQLEIVPDFVFLSKSAVRGLIENDDRRMQTQALVAAVRKLGSEIVARGVDTRAQMELCREIGCRFGQGAFRASIKQ
jgi:EAL domain-containing protein (putative c-di-GMP-specific phosphodiesterase class I)